MIAATPPVAAFFYFLSGAGYSIEDHQDFTLSGSMLTETTFSATGSNGTTISGTLNPVTGTFSGDWSAAPYDGTFSGHGCRLN